MKNLAMLAIYWMAQVNHTYRRVGMLIRFLYRNEFSIGKIEMGKIWRGFSNSIFYTSAIRNTCLLHQKSKNQTELIEHHGRKTLQAIIAELKFPLKLFTEVNLKDYHDAHVFHPLGAPDNWEKVQPLLKLMFNTSTVDWYEKHLPGNRANC